MKAPQSIPHFANSSANSIETWEEYLEWLKTNIAGETEEMQQSLMQMAEEQIASMKVETGQDSAVSAGPKPEEEKPRFWSEEEIVRDYIDSLSPETREQWMNARREDLISLHWGAGQWIRNYYKLWHPENPHTRGYRDSPDTMSGRIIKRVWDELHGAAKQPKRQH